MKKEANAIEGMTVFLSWVSLIIIVIYIVHCFVLKYDVDATIYVSVIVPALIGNIILKAILMVANGLASSMRFWTYNTIIHQLYCKDIADPHNLNPTPNPLLALYQLYQIQNITKDITEEDIQKFFKSHGVDKVDRMYYDDIVKK